MRAMWCTLIALCLVAAGAQPRRTPSTPHGTPTLRVTHAAPAAAVRRSGAPSSQLGPYVAADAVAVIAPPRTHAVEDAAAPVLPTPAPRRAPRSSRGPPHA